MANTGARRSPQKYPDESRERAVGMVVEVRRETGESHGVMRPRRPRARHRCRVAAELGEPGRGRLGTPAGHIKR